MSHADAMRALGEAVYLHFQRRAIAEVQKAIRRGALAPLKTEKCVDCGEPARCYDHRDYGKPLDVVPVCRRCNLSRGGAVLTPEVVIEILGDIPWRAELLYEDLVDLVKRHKV